MMNCEFHLVSLPRSVTAREILSKLEPKSLLITGIPHGWILAPQGSAARLLKTQQWNLFILGQSTDPSIGRAVADAGGESVQGVVSIPRTQFDRLVADEGKTAEAANDTPPLGAEWSDGSTGRIPIQHILPAKDGALEPGELKLYEPMATYLSTALPSAVRDKPVSLFNLFKYRDGDQTVHEHYMQGFKERFGPAAGAQLKFMGPVSTQPGIGGKDSGMSWQDANLVQYDSIWHYAYMLSTEVYAELNEEKIRGLEDTCILLISEVEIT